MTEHFLGAFESTVVWIFKSSLKFQYFWTRALKVPEALVMEILKIDWFVKSAM